MTTESPLSKTSSYLNSIKNDLRASLAKSAIEYLKTGIELFHKASKTSDPSIEVAIGNLGISIELMIKAFLINENPLLIFSEIPLDLKVLFCSGKEAPTSFRWRLYDVELKSFRYNTIELDEAISLFYIYFPEQKQKFHSYLKLLARSRNLSVHAALPRFHKYDLERVAYLALSLYKLLNEKEIFSHERYYPKTEDAKFLESYNEERSERVKRAIEKAKEESKKLKHDISFSIVEGWEAYTTTCPICASEGTLTGYSELEGDFDEDGLGDVVLVFAADNFECSSCKLKLGDIEEMKLAGMETSFDRNKDMNEWLDDGNECY